MRSRLLDGKVIAVTGAASGIGMRAAVACAEHGASVALLDRDDNGLRRTAYEFPLIGTRTLCVPVDVADNGSVAGAFRAVSSAFGRLDGLVNAVGPAPNVRECFLCCRAAVPLIEASGGGSVVNNASTAALVALTRTLAENCTRHRVRFNAVSVGGEGRPSGADPDPVGRMIVYLLSVESRSITGSALVVDGG